MSDRDKAIAGMIEYLRAAGVGGRGDDEFEDVIAEIGVALNKAGADVTYRTTPDGTFYYPITDLAFNLMKPLLCVVVQPSDEHETFTHAFPTLTLKEKANGPQ